MRASTRRTEPPRANTKGSVRPRACGWFRYQVRSHQRLLGWLAAAARGSQQRGHHDLVEGRDDERHGCMNLAARIGERKCLCRVRDTLGLVSASKEPTTGGKGRVLSAAAKTRAI